MIVINAAAARVFNVQGECSNVHSENAYNVESLAGKPRRDNNKDPLSKRLSRELQNIAFYIIVQSS